MATKLTFIGAKPAATTGTDVQNAGPQTVSVADQNLANLQSAVDGKMPLAGTAGAVTFGAVTSLGRITVGASGAYTLIAPPAAGGAISMGCSAVTVDRNLILGFVNNTNVFTPVITIKDASKTVLIGTTTENTAGGCLQLKSGITFPATQVASSDPNTLDDYREPTFTATGVGFTVMPTCLVRAAKAGRLVTLEIPTLAGTSNVAGFTITGLPLELRPTGDLRQLVQVQNNAVNVVGMVTINNAGVINVYSDVSANSFVTSGTKALVNCNISYII